MIVAFSFCWVLETFSKTVSVANENQFATAIAGNDGDTISITNGFTTSKSHNLQKSVTILGNGNQITRGNRAHRISFSANVNIQNLVLSGGNLNNSDQSFLLVAAGKKVTMDGKTKITGNRIGTVLTVEGTLVGGVVTGNQLSAGYSTTGIVLIGANGKMINSLLYGNQVAGTRRIGGYYNGYLIYIQGGQLINATVVNNAMSTGSNSTTRSYAITSANKNSIVANSILALNNNSQATSANCNIEFGDNLSTSQVKNTYYQVANPGFVDAASNDYTLSASSSCVDGGSNAYVTESYDLAGLDRLSGQSVDQGAFEYQSCARITASKSKDLIIGEKVVLEVKSVNSEYANVAYEFQWQSSRDGSTWSNIGRNANEARYIIDQVSDSIPYYRVNLVKKGGSREVLCTAMAPSLRFADPYVRFVISGYDRVVTHYAYEVPFENKITFGLEAINHATITAFNLEESKLERGKIRDLDASNVFDYKYTLTVDDAYAYKLSYAYRIGTTTVEKDTSFIIRPIYKCTGKSNQLIFKDDFGTFDKSANGGNGSYTYVDSVNISHTITRYTQSDRTQRNIKSGNGNSYGPTYAAPDFQNAVVGHTYSGENGFAVNDGFYTIAPTTHDAWNGHEGYFGNYPDHTAGDGKGGMLGVNCRENSKDTRIYQRDFSVECDSSLVIFSSYVANFNCVDYSDYNSTRKDPLINANVRLDIFELDEDKKEHLIGVAYSGDLLSREHDYDNVPGVDSYWSNLSAKFLANSGVTYRIALTNNRNGGSGNDMLFDDITITACCPDMAISDNPSFVNENQNVEICGSDSSTYSIYAIMRDGTVADDYFVSPYYYLYQYREKGSNQWNNLIEGDNPYVSEHKYTIDLNTFPTGSECRVILARSTQRIQQIVKHYNGTLTDASLTEEQRYPPVECKEGIYGVAYGYSISYYPELTALGDDKVRVACPGEKITFSYDPGEVWKQRTWLDADKKALTSDNSTSYSATKSSNEIDTYYYVVAGEGGACPDTVSFEAHLNHSLALLEADDIVASAGDGCKANVALASYKPEYSYCAPDLKSVDYSYQVNKEAWVDYTAASKALVANGDSVTWRAILYVTGETSALDTAYYTEHVTVTDDVEPLIDCATLSQVIELPAANEIVGDASVSVSASDIRNVSSDNCTDATDLIVNWNSYSGTDMMAFGEGPENVQLNVYNNPKAEIIWQVVDEANNESAPCIATYEIKKDKYDGPDGPFAVIRDTTICEGDFPFTWYGHVFEADGDTAHVGYALLKVFADSSYFETIKVTACGSYTFRGETFYESDVVTRTYKADGATCDSVITLDMTINPVYDITIPETACDSFTWNGVTYTESGVYTKEFKSEFGCDSIVTLDLTISKSFYDTIHVAVANQYTWDETHKTYYHSGLYVNSLKNVDGCDSIYALDLTIYPPTRGDTTIILCKKELPYKYTAKFANVLDGAEKSLTKDTVITYARENMGDSIITFKMIVLEETSADFTRDVCRNEFPFEFNLARGLVVNEPHDTVFVIENSVGCDSTIYLHLNILEPSPLTIVDEVACESFTYRGVVYDKDTTFTVDDLKNVAGCDSIINVTIKINKTINTIEDLGEVCDSVFWHDNWYYETNNVAQFATKSTVTGCDSIVTLNVVVNHSVTTRDQMHLCTSQFDADGKYTATKWGKTIDLPSTIPGTVEETFDTVTAKGCDSIVNLTFFVDYSIDIKDTVIAKDRYVWPVDNKEYTVSGTYYTEDPDAKNDAGCDSIGQVVLRIVPTKTETVNVTECDKYSVTFGSVAYTTNKDTSWNIKLAYDTLFSFDSGEKKVAEGDSILTINVKINRKDTVYLPIETICAPIVWNGINVDRSGSFAAQSISTVTGCDSITYGNFRLRVAKQRFDTVSICDSYTWDKNGVNYTTSQDVEEHVSFKDGTCDSVVYYLHLTIKEQTSRDLNVSLSQVGLDTFSVEGHKGFVPEAIKKEDGTVEPVVLTAAESAKNTFLSIRKNAAGCDSTVNVHVTLLQSSDTTKLNEAICEADLPYTLNVSGVDYKVKGDTAVMTKNKIGGDSLVALSLKINKANSENVRINECGLTYTWNGKVYTESTLDTFKTVNAAGCDSLVYLDLTLRKPTYTVEHINACDSIEWNGVMYKESHMSDAASEKLTFEIALGLTTGEALPYYIESKKNAAGCDSVVILDLTVSKTVYGPVVPMTDCDSVKWLVNDEHPNGIYKESGLYTARTKSIASDCDSVAYLDLTILKSTVLDTVLKVCENQPMVFDGKTIEGDTTFHIDNVAGCDSTINVKVQLFPVYNVTETKVTCDSVVAWLDTTLRTSGIYTKTLKTKECGCDSVISLNLTINPSPVVSFSETACGRYELGGKYYTESGVVTDTFSTKSGCDSIVIVDLTVLKPTFVAGDTIKTYAGDDCKSEIKLDQVKPSFSYCKSDANSSYTYSKDSINWSVVTPEGTTTVENGDTIYWRVDLSDEIGKLDSIVKTQVVKVTDTTAPQFMEDCSAWVSAFKVVDTITGNVSFNLSADSIRVKMKDNCSDNASLNVQWSVNGSEFVTMTKDSLVTLNAYKGDKVEISWRVVDENGNASAVCDKSYEVERDTTGEDGEKYSIIRDTVVCSNDMPLTWHGATFNADGDTAHVGTTLLNVHINKSFFVIDTIVACDNYVWRDGITYTASNNTAVYNAANVGTCDSVYTLNLTILKSTKLDTVITVCESQLPIALGGSTIGSDTTFTLSNVAGCDSLVNIKLNIIPTKRDTAVEIACSSYEWNNMVLTESGFYSDTLTSDAGCDSISVLNLTIALPAYDTIVAKNVCHAYTMNGVDYTKSGIYNDTLHTAAGCDSIVTLNLTIAPVVYDTVPMRIYCGSLMWNGKEYTETGLYNDTLVSNVYGCDSIVTLNLVNAPSNYNIELTTCEGLPAVYKDINVTKDTVLVVPGADGCDVVYNVTLHVIPALAGDTADVVACENYLWNGITLTESGVYKDTVSSSVGCDSVAILRLTIAHPDTIIVNDTIMAGESYVSAYGYTIENAAYGVYNYDTTIVSASGCEDLIKFSVTAMGRAIVIDSLVISGGENGYNGSGSDEGNGNGNGEGGNGGNGQGGNGEGGNGGNGQGGNGGNGENGSNGAKVIVNGGLWFCSGDYADVKVYATGAPSEVELTFDSLSTAAGFSPIKTTLEADGSVQFFVPDTVDAGKYVAYIQLHGEGMSSQRVKVDFMVSLSGDVIKRKWNDVVVCNNSDTMFVAYQWYKNNEKIDGATAQYYNDLTGVEGTYSLDVVTVMGDTLHVCGKSFEMLLPEFSITAYPVPAVANEELTIQVMGLTKDQLEHAKLVVYSVDGSIMYKDFDGLFDLNVITLPIGDYVAVVTVDNGLSASCKILVRP